jgi:hypothetical protein
MVGVEVGNRVITLVPADRFPSSRSISAHAAASHRASNNHTWREAVASGVSLLAAT